MKKQKENKCAECDCSSCEHTWELLHCDRYLNQISGFFFCKHCLEITEMDYERGER